MLAVHVIHGPNLHRLGRRAVALYGRQTLTGLNEALIARGQEWGISVACAQYVAEGDLMNALDQAEEEAQGVVLNPGAYAHTSYALRDTISDLRIPVIEVHLTNLCAREDFRKSVTAGVCRGQIQGLGSLAYEAALWSLYQLTCKVKEDG